MMTEGVRRCDHLRRLNAEAALNRLSQRWCAGTVARTQGRRWSDKLIDLWTCEVAAR